MGFVYILQNGDAHEFKIGKADNHEQRAKALATGNPALRQFAIIETDYPFKSETWLKHKLWSKRVRGSSAQEFYRLAPEEMSVVVAEADAYEREWRPRILEAKRLSREECDGRIVQPTGTILEMFDRLSQVTEDYYRLAQEKEQLEVEFMLAMGTAAEMRGVATWATVSQQRFNRAAFDAMHPGMYDKFRLEIRFRRFTLL